MNWKHSYQDKFKPYEIVSENRDPILWPNSPDAPAGFSRVQRRKWKLWINTLTGKMFTRKSKYENEWIEVAWGWCPFFLANTTTDSWSDKSWAIYRTGNVWVKQSNPIHEVDVSWVIRALNSWTTNQFIIDPMDVVWPKFKLWTSADPIAFWEMWAYNSINNFDNKGRDFKIFNAWNANAMIIKAWTWFVWVNNTLPTSNFHLVWSIAKSPTVLLDHILHQVQIVIL